MNRRVRLLAIFFVLCIALLVAQLANLQVRQAHALQHSPFAPHVASTSVNAQRGEIISADGYVLAKSVKVPGGGYRRVYPQGKLFAAITGYVDTVNDNISTGLEAEYGNPYGTTPASQYLLVHQYPTHGLSGYLNQRSGTDTITITVTRALQAVAAQALGSLTGALVAWNPQNGDILALYSSPSYNPNKLASTNPKEVNSYYNSLNPNSATSPLVNEATHALNPPGSTFKIVTSSALFHYKPSLANKVWPAVSGTPLPNTTRILHNYDSELCGGDLAQVFAQSCDSAFGLIGMSLGPQALANETKAFGFGQAPPIDLPSGPPSYEVEPAYFPPASTFSAQDPFLAYSAIGQGNVKETPLQDALIAGAIADGGKMMTPHLLSRVVNDQGTIVKTFRPHMWRRATTPTIARKVLHLMRGVTSFSDGTAYGLNWPPGITVAAKTGTAQVGTAGCLDNWLVATAPAGVGQTPTVAVAGYVPYQPGVPCNSTGASAAGPRVATLLTAALAQQAQG